MAKPKRLRIKKYTCKEYQKAALEFLKPPESLTVSEWAEKYRVLDNKTSAEPGPWSNRRTPYLVGIMDEFTNYETEEIIFVKPTQVGGTEAMNNARLCYYAGSGADGNRIPDRNAGRDSKHQEAAADDRKQQAAGGEIRSGKPGP